MKHGYMGISPKSGTSYARRRRNNTLQVTNPNSKAPNFFQSQNECSRGQHEKQKCSNIQHSKSISDEQQEVLFLS